MELKDRIRHVRKRKGLKQTYVSERIGINYKTYSGYERGLGTPSPETLRKMAEVFEVSLDYLIGGKQPEGEQSLDDIIDDFKSQMEGRDLTDEDKKKVLDAVMEVIWESRNKG